MSRISTDAKPQNRASVDAWTTFEPKSGDVKLAYLEALHFMAKAMATRFGPNVHVWLEKNGDGMRVVYKVPGKHDFNSVRGVPARQAKGTERPSTDERLHVSGRAPHIAAAMQRPIKATS